MYGTVRSWKSLIMNVIRTELSELSAHYLKKTVTFDFVYILSSAHIDQSAPNIEFNYECYRDRIVRVICPLFKKTVTFDCLHYVICIYRPVSTKPRQNINVQQNLNEFDHGSNWTRTTRVIWSWIVKIAAFDFVYSLTSTNINQSAPNMVTMNMNIRSRMSLIMGQVIQDH